MFSVHFLLRPKKTNQKKRRFLVRYFLKIFKINIFKNHILKAKFSPRLQKFLTLLKYYTYDKGFMIGERLNYLST